MSATTDVTLIKVLEHKHLFFDLLDHTESLQGANADELMVSAYNHYLGNELNKLSAKERRRLAGVLSLENLHRAGLLMYSNEREGIFMLKPFVMDMIRHIDSTRLRELSDADLNALREQFKHVNNEVFSTSFRWYVHDHDFTEAMASIYSTFRSAASQIQSNIESLHGQSIKLAEIIDSDTNEHLSRGGKVRFALKEIARITERHIYPTLLFLDPNTDWKGSGESSPMRLMSDVLARFQREGFHGEYEKINRIYLNLMLSAEKINKINKGLSRYIRMYESQRKMYERIESRFNDLSDRVRALQDGKLTYRLKVTDPHFDLSATFHGLKDIQTTYTAKIDWPTERGRANMEEALRSRLEVEKLKMERPRTKATKASDMSLLDRRRRLRMKAIQAAAKDCQLAGGSDVYSQVHERLTTTLCDYQLPELIDAVHFATGKVGHINLGKRRVIIHDGRKLDYFERHIKEQA